MKMGTTGSLWRYDAASEQTLLLSELRWPANFCGLYRRWPSIGTKAASILTDYANFGIIQP
jgi:hypothetical protein